MGLHKNETHESKTKSKKRGSVRNADRLAAFAPSTPSSGADWGGCDPRWLQAVIVGVTTLGGAVTFGMSRDQGAHSLTLLLDDKRQTLWFNAAANLDEELQAAAAILQAID